MVLGGEGEVKDGEASEREAGHGEAHDGATLEGDAEAGTEALAAGVGGADVGLGGDVHAEPARGGGEEGSEQDADDQEEAAEEVELLHGGVAEVVGVVGGHGAEGADLERAKEDAKDGGHDQHKGGKVGVLGLEEGAGTVRHVLGDGAELGLVVSAGGLLHDERGEGTHEDSSDDGAEEAHGDLHDHQLQGLGVDDGVAGRRVASLLQGDARHAIAVSVGVLKFRHDLRKCRKACNTSLGLGRETDRKISASRRREGGREGARREKRKEAHRHHHHQDEERKNREEGKKEREEREEKNAKRKTKKSTRSETSPVPSQETLAAAAARQ